LANQPPALMGVISDAVPCGVYWYLKPQLIDFD
jgi:hypothetical protein